ncbi:MAG: endo-1,4-beta-xylanase [Spirochaetales bacterium]|nr:endo-1,4-beta-xylanase [Spirochaetales bacterium]
MKKEYLFIIIIVVSLVLAGCLDSPKTGTIPSLYETYAGYFDIGAAVGVGHLGTVHDIFKKHFNRFTAENDMKAGPIHPAKETYCFDNGDAIANFARENGKKLNGHTLVWHSQQPYWLFHDEGGNAVSETELRSRLYDHITTVVGHYKDIIDNWDVVNEAISDSPGKTYRDGKEGSEWYGIFGDEEYIKLAFQYAAEADPDALLFYNDYNAVAPSKVAKIKKMVQWLQSEKVKIDGIGLQGHWNLEWPSLTDIKRAIDEYSSLGLKVKISELDISIYNDYAGGSFQPEAEKRYTKEIEYKQAERYRGLFELFRAKKDVIVHVTFWGVSDDATWLDYFPAGQRNNHPLLFDDNHQPKKALKAIVNF